MWAFWSYCFSRPLAVMKKSIEGAIILIFYWFIQFIYRFFFSVLLFWVDSITGVSSQNHSAITNCLLLLTKKSCFFFFHRKLYTEGMRRSHIAHHGFASKMDYSVSSLWGWVRPPTPILIFEFDFADHLFFFSKALNLGCIKSCRINWL